MPTGTPRRLRLPSRTCESGHFSRAGLIHQLESPYGEHFTHAQAVYGVSVAYR